MKMYLLALSVGILVGIILVGEQVVPVAKRLLAGQPITTAWIRSDCVPHVFGPLPARPAAPAEARAGEPGDRSA